MFIAKHNNPINLLKYFNTIKDIVDNINLFIDEDGITIKGMDNSQICLLHCFLSCNEFIEFSLKKSLNLGIHIKTFCKILSASEKIDTLMFRNTDSDILDIIFENNYRKSNFSYKLIHLDFDDIEIGVIIFPVKIDLCIKRFSKIYSEIDLIESNNINFNVDSISNSINISGNGELGDLETKLKFTKEKKLKFKNKNDNGKILSSIILQPEYIIHSLRENFNVEFSLKKIGEILKISNLVNRIIINISESDPLKLEFITSKHNSYIHYYIAPKINMDNY